MLTSHLEGKAEPVASASAEKQIWVVHRGSFVACWRDGEGYSRAGPESSSVVAGALTGSRRFLPNQSELARPGEGLGAVPCAEFAVDVACVALDGAHGDEEIPGYL